MAEAERRAEEMAGSDAVAGPLAVYLRRHLAEERDHPSWLLEDLEALGRSRRSVLDGAIPASIARLVGAQYVWVGQGHPVAVIGHLVVLEGYPPTSGWLEGIRKRTGLPREAFRFLLAHAEIDPHHAADLYRLLDDLPLTRAHTGLVGISALHTMQSLGEVFHELAAGADDGR